MICYLPATNQHTHVHTFVCTPSTLSMQQPTVGCDVSAEMSQHETVLRLHLASQMYELNAYLGRKVRMLFACCIVTWVRHATYCTTNAYWRCCTDVVPRLVSEMLPVVQVMLTRDAGELGLSLLGLAIAMDAVLRFTDACKQESSKPSALCLEHESALAVANGKLVCGCNCCRSSAMKSAVAVRF